MPEGQVSHKNAIRFGAALTGRPLTRVDVPEPRLRDIGAERLVGDTVTAAEAVGKHHILRFASGRVLWSHLMMSGVWRLLPASRTPRPGGLFLALWTDRDVAALYRCPNVRLLEPGEPLPRAVRTTGPDLLGEDVDPGRAAAERLARVEPTREVGEVLMDQRVVSGIGNVYKCETCFLTGIDPWRPVGSLSDEEATAIGAEAARLLQLGVDDRGPIRTWRPPDAPPWARERTWVYGRRGRPCRRCGTPIRSRGQGDANRTTYWCPTCQT